MQASAVIGRVGGLAIALGIGLVIGGVGVAGASPSDSSDPSASAHPSATAVKSGAATLKARASSGRMPRPTPGTRAKTNPARSIAGSVGRVLVVAARDSSRDPKLTASVSPVSLARGPSAAIAAAHPVSLRVQAGSARFLNLGPDLLTPMGSVLAWTVAFSTQREIESTVAASGASRIVTSGQVAVPAIAQVANQPPVISKIILGSPDGKTGAVTGTVMATDPNGDQVFYAATASAKGTITITKAGVFTYTPTASAQHDAARTGAKASLTSDTVTVTVADAMGALATQAVVVPIRPRNSVPTVTQVRVLAPNATSGVVTGTVSATDPDGDRLNFTTSASTSRGTLTINASAGAFTYTPTNVARANAAKIGATAAEKADDFTVTITDGHGGTTTIVVTVEISPKPNTPPTAGTPALSVNAGTGVVTGFVSAIDPDGDKVSYTTSTQTARGIVAVTTEGVFTYKPTDAARHSAARDNASLSEQTDSFVVVASDGRGGTASIPVALPISPANSSPTGASAMVGIPNPKTGQVTGTVGATDADRDVLTFLAPASTAKGAISINASTGAFTYTPSSAARANAAKAEATAADRADTFAITIKDGYGGLTSVAVTVAIRPINSAPVAGTPTIISDSVTGIVTGSINAIDRDGDPITYSPPILVRSKGSVEVTSAGTFTYTPTLSARHAAAKNNVSSSSLTDTFTVTASDGLGGTTNIPVTVRISPQNSVPVAGIQLIPAPDATTGVVVGTVIATDSDGDSLSYSGSTTTSSGKVSVASSGNFTYTPTSTARGSATSATTDSFTVTASDGYGGVISVPVTVRVLPVPTVAVGIPNLTTGVVSGSVAAPKSDVGPFTFSAPTITAKGSLTINAVTGAFVYAPSTIARHRATADNASSADKEDTFVVALTDAQGILTYAPLVTVPIRPSQNNGPTGSAIVGAVDPTTGVITGTITGTDLDGDTLTYSGSRPLAEGKVTVDSATGAFTYTPISRVDTVTSVIRGFSSPEEVVFSPDGSRAYISDSTRNLVSVIDTATQTAVAVIGGLSTPRSLAITPDGRRLYVTESTSVSILDTSTNAVIGSVSDLYSGVGGRPSPSSVAVSPDGSLAYVVNAKVALSIVDTSINKVVATISLSTSGSSGLGTVFFSPNAQRAYVMGGGWIDTATNKVSSGGSGSIVFSPDSSRWYVANGLNLQEVSDKSRGRTAVSTITSSGWAISPAGDLLYGLGNGGQVALVDATTMTSLGNAKYKCGNCSAPSTSSSTPRPKGIAVSPDGSMVYAVNSANGTVSVLTKWNGPTTDTFAVLINDGHGGSTSVPVTVSFVG